MLEKYQEAMMRAVKRVGDRKVEERKALLRSSLVGVGGMLIICSDSSLGLLPRRVVHVCCR